MNFKLSTSIGVHRQSKCKKNENAQNVDWKSQKFCTPPNYWKLFSQSHTSKGNPNGRNWLIATHPWLVAPTIIHLIPLYSCLATPLFLSYAYSPHSRSFYIPVVYQHIECNSIRNVVIVSKHRLNVLVQNIVTIFASEQQISLLLRPNTARFDTEKTTYCGPVLFYTLFLPVVYLIARARLQLRTW